MQINDECRTALLAADASDEEIDGFTVSLTKLAIDSNNPFWLLINGYDDDKRELWEIPEIKSLCERLVSRGLIGALQVKNMDRNNVPALTALDVWMISKGRMNGNTYVLTRQIFDEFYGDLMKANYTADRLIKSQNPEDAQHIYAMRFGPKDRE